LDCSSGVSAYRHTGIKAYRKASRRFHKASTMQEPNITGSNLLVCSVYSRLAEIPLGIRKEQTALTM